MPLPIARVVLYKHGVGYFEREGKIDGDAVLPLTFKQSEVSDVLKSLTVLDLRRPTTIRREDLRTRCGWSPFEGVTFPGSVAAVFVRGERPSERPA